METIKATAEAMLHYVQELQTTKLEKNKLLARTDIEETEKRETLDTLNLTILQHLSTLDNYNEQLALLAYNYQETTTTLEEPAPPLPPTEILPTPGQEIIITPVPLPPSGRTVNLEKEVYDLVKINTTERKKLLQELGIPKEQLKNITKKTYKNTLETPYSLYKEQGYGKIANTFFGWLTLSLSKKYFSDLRQSIIKADIKILSKTYISSMFFTTLLLFLLVGAGSFTYQLLINHLPIITAALKSLLYALIIAGITYFLYYTAPLIITNGHKRAIKNDLPFVIIHMAAVAGSGASPVAMFHLVLSTGEYKGLEREIKKILNYVNLFGYNLTSALRAVSITTPNKEFKDLLNGIISVTESGGDIKYYLKEKADDTFNNYRLERKRYVETLSTYSDLYVGILLAAPLLFIVTLTIINLLGGTIGGIDINTISYLGTYLAIPLLNIGFLIFLNIMQPEG
ncbi:MAG: type II secretion system F family protein [Nanoarchaeota archaeon]|nr:type II secretion system F family protein [Nanoarchaeota archaeon]